MRAAALVVRLALVANVAVMSLAAAVRVGVIATEPAAVRGGGVSPESVAVQQWRQWLVQANKSGSQRIAPSPRPGEWCSMCPYTDLDRLRTPATG